MTGQGCVVRHALYRVQYRAETSWHGPAGRAVTPEAHAAAELTILGHALPSGNFLCTGHPNCWHYNAIFARSLLRITRN
jgi:hypothetical protein